MIRRPYRPANVHSDVVTPLLQAAITAILATVGAGLAAYQFEWDAEIVVLVFIVVFGGMWLLLLRSHRQHLWTISQEEQPEPEAAPVKPQPQDWRVEITQRGPEKNRASIARLTMPAGISPDQFTTVAWETLRGTPFTERQWHGRGIEVTDFRALRHELLKAGYLAWKVAGAPTQGVSVTEPGRAFFRQVAQEGKLNLVESPSPTPDDDEQP